MAATVVTAATVTAATVTVTVATAATLTVVTAATVDIITAIGSLAGRVGFTAIGISGAASGIAGIRTAITDPVGMFATLTDSQRNQVASGAPPLADL